MSITAFNDHTLHFFAYLIELYHPMKKTTIAFLLTLFCITTHAQQKKIDSLLSKLDHTQDLHKLSTIFQHLMTIPHGDLALLKKGQKDLANAEAQKNILQQERALWATTAADFSLHNSPGLLDASLKGIRVSEQDHNAHFLSIFFHEAALAYVFAKDYRKSGNYSLQAAAIAIKARDTLAAAEDLSNIESNYATFFNKPDSALYYAKWELTLVNQYSGADKWRNEGIAIGDMGEAQTAAGHLDSALKYYQKAYAMVNKHEKASDLPYLINNLARTYLQLSKPDSALKYALESYDLASKTKLWEFTADASALLSKIYEGDNDKKSLFYLKAQMAANDSLNESAQSRQFRLIADRDKQQAEELKSAQERYNARVRLFAVIGAATVFLVIGIMLWLNNRKQKRTNLLLNEQKQEIEAQRDNLKSALENLKTAQAQLVQAEKMASLGELTAGIAHEIQNPLNFVNNFSEVSTELIAELKEELDKGDIEEAVAIATDVEQNLGKIHHHGKRADGIVKGMLQHSRTSSGQKEPIDLNLLTDEYLRLAYHGLRAKDKDFNAEIITRFDKDLHKVNVTPQDISRVLLNLFNNAFYAVSQKAKTAEPGYKPAVEVSTSQLNGSVIISVKDNGTGIPDNIREKIMQPFFTTKPTGEGTGLGLSLSYDIVVKGHDGKIDMTSEEGQGSQFIVSLPATK